MDGAAGDGGVGLAVDQDEAAQLAVVRIALEGDRPVQLEVATADLVERQLRRRQRSLRVDVDLVPDLRDACADCTGGGLEPVAAPGEQRLRAHPEQVRGKQIGRAAGRERVWR